jgi:sugar lactone lactonase YvrE
MEAQCLVDAHNIVGECPLWHAAQNSIYWTDINGFTVQKYDLAKKDIKSWNFGEVVCALSLTSDARWFLVGLGSRLILWDPEEDRRVDFCKPEPNWPTNRLNDGAADPNGYFWIGSMRNNVASDGADVKVSGNSGSLYRIDPFGKVTTWDTGFGISNTLAWSPDNKTFYFGCSIGNVVYAYDFDRKDSSIKNRRVFFSDLPHGMPDGSAIDVEGYLWNCRYGGGNILRISPAGAIEQIIKMPVSNITNCCFGGPDMRTLYITTSSLGGSKEKFAGGLFTLQTTVAGIPANHFQLSENF